MTRTPESGSGTRLTACGLLLAVCALFLLASCGESGQDVAGSEVLNRSVGAEPESLDPHKSRSLEAGNVLRDLAEGLLGYSADGKLQPRAAERWEISPDGTLYTFWLRPEARWSNGDIVTAADFVYSFRRLVDPATAAFYAQSVIDVENARSIVTGAMPPESLGVSASGKFELQIRLNAPVPYFLALLTHPSMFPVHRASVESAKGRYARPGNFVSNGAYTLKSWTPGSVIELERNDYYWDNADTAIDRVRWYVLPEPMVALNRYRAGELDITNTVPPEAFAKMRAERPDELHVAPYLGIYYYGLNLTKPPFKDSPKLRKALSMAIDREVLTEKILGRGEVPAYSWVPPGVADYDGPRFAYATMPPAERHAEAERLYREAGYGPDHPAKIEIRYNTSETHKRIALAIQSMWHEVLGADVTLINEEFQVLLSHMRAKEVTEAFRSSWTGDYNDAHTFLQVLESDAPSNMTGYASEKFDALMRRASTQTDPEQRRRDMEDAERVLLSDHPVIPIYFYVSKHLVSRRVKGWADNVLDYHYSQHLSLSP